MRPRLAPPWLGLALALLAPTALRAAGPTPEIKIENVRVGFGDGVARSGYKTGTWTPVWIDLKAGPARFQGEIAFTVPDDTNMSGTIRRAVNIAPNEMATVTMFVRPGSRFGEMRARVIAGDRVKDEWEGGSIESFGAETSIILASGETPGLTEVKDLPKYASNSGGMSSRLLVAPVRPRDGFPREWYGFDAVDAVVLDTNDQATMNRLREASSLKTWVRQGGHLVVAVGQNWQAVLDSPIGEILPAVPSGRVDLNDPGLIDQFAGSSARPLVPPGSKMKLPVTKFEGLEKRGGVALAASSTTPLVVRGPYGFGRVTMIGLDVGQKPFSTWEDRKAFWDRLIDLRHGAAVEGGPAGNAMYRYGNSDLTSILHNSLQQFPGVRLVPFGWVAFFVFLYILLIGPGDYLFLRKVVKRMEMTWVTFPLIVIVVSGAAYAAAYYFKGTELRINKVDAVDVDQTTGLTRGWSWLTLFSPQNRDYDVGFAPLAPDADAPADPIASPTLPRNANVEVVTSWFGSPETGYGAGGGGGGMGFGGGYEYVPNGEPEALRRVRVNIWSTKSFTGRWAAAVNNPVLESDLAPEGPDRLRGTVTNVTKRPLKHAALFFGRYVYPLGEIAPGATIPLGEAQALTSYLDGLTQGLGNFSTYAPNGQLQPQGIVDGAEGQRPSAVRVLMFHGGLGPRAAQLPNTAQRTIDLTDQLDLRRPMLVADVDGPAALLRLGGQGSTPKMTQTTVLRVVLPLKGADADAGARP